MAKLPTLHLRRFYVGDVPQRFHMPANPFEAARRHELVRPLVLGIDSAGLILTPNPQDLLIRSELTLPRQGVVDVFRSNGPVSNGINETIPTVQIRSAPETGNLSANLTIDAGTTAVSAAVDGKERWQVVSEQLHHDATLVDDLIHVEGLAALGADMVVTDRAELLAARDAPLLRGLCLTSPAEALVTVGVWARVVHHAFVTGPIGVNVGLYYWSFARALTPVAWPGFCAFVQGQYALADGGALVDLAGSVLARLASGGRALDRLVALWHCATNNDINDEMLDEFDRIVLIVAAIYDNLALLAGIYLAIELDRGKPASWGLLQREWRIAMRKSSDPRAAQLVALIERDQQHFELAEPLRRQAVHRARFRPITYSEPAQAEQVKVWLEGTIWTRVKEAITKMGTTPTQWGIGPEMPAGKIPVSLVDTEGAVEEELEVAAGPQALLDPVQMAPRLLAQSARVVNAFFEVLNPRSDAAIPNTSRCDGPPADFYFAAQGANAAVLSSPVSGLVDWTLPLA